VPYSPPTRLVLRASIARDLRDPTYQTFLTAQVNDFINMGIAELNRLRPLEVVEDIGADPDAQTYPLDMTSAWRVEVWREGEFYRLVPHNEGEDSGGGWELYSGFLRVPKVATDLDPLTDVFKVWG
jgi:hypothetical protein